MQGSSALVLLLHLKFQFSVSGYLFYFTLGFYCLTWLNLHNSFRNIYIIKYNIFNNITFSFFLSSISFINFQNNYSTIDAWPPIVCKHINYLLKGGISRLSRFKSWVVPHCLLLCAIYTFFSPIFWRLSSFTAGGSSILLGKHIKRRGHPSQSLAVQANEGLRHNLSLQPTKKKVHKIWYLSGN